MKKFGIALVVLGFSAAFAADAFADDFSNCACVSKASASSAAIGSITNLNGDVLYTGTSGYAQAQSGAPLVAGSQVSVGYNSAAVISVGTSCKLKVEANSIASVMQPKGTGGNICVRIARMKVPPVGFVQEGSSTQGGPALGTPQLVMGGLVVGITGTVLAIGAGGDGPASD